MRLGFWEIVPVLVLALLIFGPNKLPQLGSSIAQFFKNFKSGIKDVEKEKKEFEASLKL